MKRQKGIAYCGLVCAVCSKNADYPGCRNEGEINYYSEKLLTWQLNMMLSALTFGRCCPEAGGHCSHHFSLKNGALGLLEDNTPKWQCRYMPCAFLIAGGIPGNYDIPATEDEIINVVLTGKT